ncbi:flagellar brake protein [Cytobacillus purgationiresistens]|uniref:C-di-GMP-binding flagellar brake protein YcgR n=1 Tax=Cytobacillus purgationiresistens TaxID=863449 RepID=A0ABU0AK58_9BACI|nr:flagellar brake domain-containing protein [Cytobacillus purgationiresistens]MDQ0271101.1 c-di-GMP-binding flagellar brake protein YcgR [Cytobacillus purgationiresistens]
MAIGVICLINCGDMIVMEPYSTDKKEKYQCEVVGKGNGLLYITYPINIETQKTTFLLEGMQSKCSIVTERGEVFLFDCEVNGRLKKKIPLIILSYPGEDAIIKIQKREYVRVDVAVDVAVHPESGGFNPFITVTEDISAGGAAILVKNPVPFFNGMKINTWFVLSMKNGETHYVQCMSEVMRCNELNELNSLISLKFCKLHDDVRRLLIRFCFDRQLALMKKRQDHLV